MVFMTIEDLHQRTGHTYRTVRKRLAWAGLQPVKTDRKSVYYDGRKALAAILSLSDGRGPDPQPAVDFDSIGFLAEAVFPILFEAGSPFAKLFLGMLRTEFGLTKEQALAALEFCALGYMQTVNRLAGIPEPEGEEWPEDPSDAPLFELSWLLQRLSELHQEATDPAEARHRFVALYWPDPQEPKAAEAVSS